MEEAEKGLKRIYTAKALMETELTRSTWKNSPLPEEFHKEVEQAEKEWTRAMDDDLNTAGALGHIFSLTRLANRILENKNWKKSSEAKNIFERILNDVHTWGQILGIFTLESTTLLTDLRNSRAKRKGIEETTVLDLIAQRTQARKDKDFDRADAIREEMTAMQVTVQDTPQGPTWDVI